MNRPLLKFCAVLFSLLAFGAAATTVCAAPFAADGKSMRLRWKNNVIPVAVSSSLTKQAQGAKSDAEVAALVRRSFANWERVAGVRFEISTVDKQSIGAAGKNGDGVNLITVAQTPENLLLFNGGGEDIAARTQTFYNARGNITEADIVLNPYQQFSVDGGIGTFDLEATLTHEVGHLLGLEHSLIPGATMFEHQGKNGVYGLPAFAPRTLSEDDVAAARTLYGAAKNSAECCGAITGKLSLPNGRAAKDFQVWIEETATGRVNAAGATNGDGVFRLEGVTAGSYSVYAQELGAGKIAGAGFFVGEAEAVRGKITSLSKKLKIAPKTFDLTHIGFNGQMSELAILLNGGKSFAVYVGGRNLDAEKLKVGFNTPNLTVAAGSPTKQDFGSGLTVLSFEVKVNSRTPPGEYSFFLRGAADETAFVAGALTVDGFVNSWNTHAFSVPD